MKIHKLAVICLSAFFVIAGGCSMPNGEKAASSGTGSAAENLSSESPSSTSPETSSSQSTGSGPSSVTNQVKNDSRSSSSKNSAEMLHTGKWVKKASMKMPRFDFGSAVVDGKIYAIGGYGQTGFLSSIEAYNPKANVWRQTGSLAISRSGMQVTVINGEIYVIGGSKSSQTASNGIIDTAVTERFEPASGKRVTLKSMHTAREYFCVAVARGKIYAIGGSSDGTVLSSVEEYNPVSDMWTEKKPMLTARMQFCVVVINSNIYVIGGYSPLDTVSTVEMYDPEKNQWIKKSSMKTPRSSFQTAIIDGKIYAIGGIDNKGNNLSSVEEYDPVLDQWTEKKAMKTPRGWFQTAIISGKILVIGGWKNVGSYSSDSFLSSVEEYDPKTDKWTKKAPVLPARSLFQTVTTTDNVFTIGGAVGSNAEKRIGTNLAQEYNLYK